MAFYITHTTHGRVRCDLAVNEIRWAILCVAVWYRKGWNRIKYIMIDIFRLLSRASQVSTNIGDVRTDRVPHLNPRVKAGPGDEGCRYQVYAPALVVLRDRYAPRYTQEHREKEVIEWFRENGFVNVSRRTTWEKTGDWKGSTDLAIKGYRTRP